MAEETIPKPCCFFSLGFSNVQGRGSGGCKGHSGNPGAQPQPSRQKGKSTGCALAAGPQLSASLLMPAPAGQLGPDATPHPMTQQKVKPDPPLLAETQCLLFPHPRVGGRGWPAGQQPVQGVPSRPRHCAPAHPRATCAHRLLSCALFVSHQSCPTEFLDLHTALGVGNYSPHCTEKTEVQRGALARKEGTGVARS